MTPQETMSPARPPAFDADRDSLTPGEEVEGAGIDWREILQVLARGHRTIEAFALGLALLAAAAAFVMKPVYTAEATFLPPGSLNGSSSLSTQLGALGALSGSATSVLGGLKSPTDIYLGMLGSRTIADAMIQKFDLLSVYHRKKMSDARLALASHTKLVSGKANNITVSVRDHDPNRAADMANAYLAELALRNDHMALTDAAQRRQFFEGQLVKEKDALADAEVDLKQTQEKTGLIDPGGQAQMDIASIAQLRGDIASREVQLSALRGGETEHNPDVVRLRTEIGDLQRQLQNLENSGPGGNRPGNVIIPTSKVPSVSLEYVRKAREVKYHELLMDIFSRQFEAARMDEANSAPLLQVVDVAVPPDHPSGPPRMLIILTGLIAGLVLGMGWVLARRTYQHFLSDPQNTAWLRNLRGALHGK